MKQKNLILIIIGIGILLFAITTLNRGDIQEKELTEDLGVATFSGGCFWCSESDFEKHGGVIEVISGYAGGIEESPTYKEVSSGTTSHREGVQVYYNTSIISYNELLSIYWRHIDPTDNGGSFVDRGTQYTPAIFVHNENQRTKAENSKQSLIELNIFEEEIIVPILEFTSFYPAEDYHQDYYKKNPIQYNFYRSLSGRDQFIEENWKDVPDFTHDWIEVPNKQKVLEGLTELQYYVTQEDGTERPFENKYWNNTEEGIYVDIVSGEPLFSSTDKFKSGTGWPSFTKPLVKENILELEDKKLFITRTELRSKNADSHLGHVFNDGPEPTGLRYCINSAALRFIPVGNLKEEGYEEFEYLFK